MKPLLKKSQRGYSLIELSIALAIVGVVIAGSIVGVQAILTSNNVNKTIKQTNNAIGKIIAKLVRDSDYSNAKLDVLTAGGFDVWQDTDISNGGTSSATVTHSLGGNVYVKPVQSNDTTSKQSYGVADNQGLIYTLTGVPVGGCADLAGGLEGLATAMTIVNETATTAASGTATNQWLVPTNAVKDNKPLPGGIRFGSQNVNSKCNGGGASSAVGTATIAFLVQRR